MATRIRPGTRMSACGAPSRASSSWLVTAGMDPPARHSSVLPHAVSHPTAHRLLACDLKHHFHPPPQHEVARPPRLDTSKLSAQDSGAMQALPTAISNGPAARDVLCSACSSIPSPDLSAIILQEVASILRTTSGLPRIPSASHFLRETYLMEEACQGGA